jgi:hypothetical protein
MPSEASNGRGIEVAGDGRGIEVAGVCCKTNLIPT